LRPRAHPHGHQPVCSRRDRRHHPSSDHQPTPINEPPMKQNVLIHLTTAALAATAFAAPPPALEGQVHGPEHFGMSDYMAGDYFFGDWGGGRARLAEAGITFDGYYVMNPAANVSGGKKT